jgi:CheY-like chemotaxis protein
VILAVDDDALVLDVIVSALTDGGYAVLEAGTAEEAIAILEQRAGDLAGVVSDVNLGRGKPPGWDVARRARELNPGIAVVYLTGDSAHEWTAYGVPHSVMLDKPFAAAEVVVAVASARATV